MHWFLSFIEWQPNPLPTDVPTYCFKRGRLYDRLLLISALAIAVVGFIVGYIALGSNVTFSTACVLVVAAQLLLGTVFKIKIMPALGAYVVRRYPFPFGVFK